MGRYNEFSDDVVNALSSGALKVVEALEIEDPTGTWWRLIQAKDETTARVFLKRRYPTPIFSSGTLDLSTHWKKIGRVGMWRNNSHEPICGVATYGDTEKTPYFYVIYYDVPTNDFVRAEIFDVNGNRVHTIGPYKSYSDYNLKGGAFWDDVNQRLIVTFYYSPYSEVRTVSAGLFANNFVFNGSTWLSWDAAYTPPKTFPEAPGAVYTLFKYTNQVVLKKVTITPGISAHTVSYESARSGGGITIDVASNYRAPECDLFYSRKHQSVALAWVNATDGKVYYALESENWANAYILSDVTSTPGVRLETCGNMVFPSTVGEGAGEYYVLNLRRQEDGVLGKPEGYSYPANLTFIGACPASENEAALFMHIGSDVYIYHVDIDTMAITSVSNRYTLPFDPGTAWKPWKIGDDGAGRELYILQRYGKQGTSKNASNFAFLLCYDRNSLQVLWTWGASGEWSSSTYFPNTRYTGTNWYNWRQQYLFSINNTILVWQMANSSTARSEHYWVPVSSALACNTSADFSALLLNKHYLSNIASVMDEAYVEYPFRTIPQADTCVSWGDTGVGYVVGMMVWKEGTSQAYYRFFKFDATTGDLAHVSKDIYVASDSYYCLGAPYYIPEERRYEYNFNSLNPEVHPYAHLYCASYMRFVNEEMTSTANIPISVSTTPWPISFNNYGAAGLIRGSGNYAYIYGASYTSLIGCSYARLYKILALPFTFKTLCKNEFDNWCVLFSDPTDGEIHYTKTGIVTGDYAGTLFINAENITDTYEATHGFQLYGGCHAFGSYGGWAFMQDLTGMFYILDTEATINDYIGGSGADEGGVIVPIIYDYETLEYIPYPWEREGIRLEISKLSKTCKVALPDTPDSTIRNMLLSNDFRGCRCIIRRLFLDADLQNGAPDLPLLDGFIQDWGYSTERGAVLFSVSRPLIDITSTFPRRIMNMGCSHVFKGKRCQYTGEDTQCSKTWEDCVAKGNEQHFGGFPWVAVRQRKVMWK